MNYIFFKLFNCRGELGLYRRIQENLCVHFIRQRKRSFLL